MRLLRLKNLWSCFLVAALLVLQVAFVRAQEQGVTRASSASQAVEKVSMRESNKEQAKESTKESNGDLTKSASKESLSVQNLPRLREPNQGIPLWLERVEQRQKMRELKRQRIEQGELPKPNPSPLPRADLRSILQSPKREDVLQERAMRQELKAQMERRRQVMQELRERRERMSVEERRALRKQILDASQGMPPPPRR